MALATRMASPDLAHLILTSRKNLAARSVFEVLPRTVIHVALCLFVAGCTTVSPPAVQAPAPVESVVLPPGAVLPAPSPVPVPELPRSAPPPPVFIPTPAPPPPLTSERALRGSLMALLPRSLVRERDAWAADMSAAFLALRIPPTLENLCAAIAVIEQESGFVSDPVVPGLSRMAWKEIETRRARYRIPKLALDAALSKTSRDGRTYRQRINKLRTEREMSVLFGEMIDEVPGGKLLLSGYNPVRTGGPMQVSVAFAEAHSRVKPYPDMGRGGAREAVFSRRGGLHFGIAHLLDYPASYPAPLYRFADFNAGHYASRNAAFQLAVARLSGHKLAPDGDLLRYEDGRPAAEPSATQKALLSLARRVRMDDRRINAELLQEKDGSFARTTLYARVFELADRAAVGPMAREALPRIALQSPKITRKLTTAWFAERVNTRFGDCLARAPRPLLHLVR